MSARNAFPPSDIEAAFDWWALAGVDCDFADDATDWLVSSGTARDDATSDASIAPATGHKSAAAESRATIPRKLDLLGEAPPRDLAAFREFWLAEPGLDAIGPRGRIGPEGDAGADLMVLVVDPEEADQDALLSGPQGALLDAILAAFGCSREEVYLASALPRHTPMADPEALVAGGIGDVLQHHIALAAPKRLLTFGANLLPLLGHGATQDLRAISQYDSNDRAIPMLASEGLDSLMAMPRLKARLWRRWLEWTKG